MSSTDYFATDPESKTKLLLSGGGEFCLVYWQLDERLQKCLLLKKYIKRKHADCRVMAIVSFPIKSIKRPIHIIVIGISNATIEIFAYDELTRKSTLLSIISSHYGPILTVQHLCFPSTGKFKIFLPTCYHLFIQSFYQMLVLMGKITFSSLLPLMVAY